MALCGLRRPGGTAAEMGYRLPGEFEPMEAVWLAYPHNRETWPGCFEAACEQYEQFVRELRRFVRVELTAERGIATDDSWIRDFGPIFVVDDAGGLGCHDFVFNGWGGKYGGAEGAYERDDVVPRHVAKLLDVPIWLHELVLEGGSIDGNGRGTLLTTEQCLLNPNRNAGLGRGDLERRFAEAFGVSHTIWLPGGIIGDDTDGHVDDIARFVAPTTVVACAAPEGHSDAEVLNANLAALKGARDARGERLTVVPLPVPEPIMYDFPADRFGPGGRHPVPASYANFLIANEGVLVPVFGQAGDEAALRVMEEAMPGREVVPVRAEYLVVGLGALHCLSQQQPVAG